MVLPTLVLAQGPPNHCLLRHSVTQIDPACVARTRVGSVSGYGVQLVQAWGLCCAISAIHTVVDWIFIALVALAGILFLLGAYNIITAGGEPAKVTTGRNFIIYAIAGLALALLARAVPNLAAALIGATI